MLAPAFEAIINMGIRLVESFSIVLDNIDTLTPVIAGLATAMTARLVPAIFSSIASFATYVTSA